MILELHRKSKKNIGDYWCNPSRYFDFPDINSRRLNDNHDVRNQNLIIGGGGLIVKNFSTAIQSLLAQHPKISALWGVGHNSKSLIDINNYEYYPAWINKFALVGIRDWIPSHHSRYLPCVSCMHPAFDTTYDEKHEVVFYPRPSNKSLNQDKDKIVFEHNGVNDFDRLIAFLGSARTVVTDSYHAAYWAQLLGKDVKVRDWSIKFKHMRYAPTFIDSMLNFNTNKLSFPESGFLEESRYLNKRFYQLFLSLL